MADVKISALPVAASLDSSETIVVVQGGITKQALISQITVIAPTATRSGNLLDAFASGTALVFNQTAAPTGWTKSATHNDKALRVVSGTVGSGGATAFTSVFGAAKSAGSYTLTTADIPSHQHAPGGATDFIIANTPGGAAVSTIGGAQLSSLGNGALTAATGGGGGHTHTLSLDLQYADVIIATKD